MASDAASARVGLAPSSVDGESLCRGAEESQRAVRRRRDGERMAARALLQASGPLRCGGCDDVVAAMAAPAAPELVLRPVLEVHSARWRARRGSSETGSAPMYLDRRSPALSHAIKGAPLSALRIRRTTLQSGGGVPATEVVRAVAEARAAASRGNAWQRVVMGAPRSRPLSLATRRRARARCST